MNDFLEEENEIMDEQTAKTSEHSVSQGISIEDPIKVLNLELAVAVQDTANLKETITLMNDKSIGCVVVVNKKDELVGIFTERDVLRKICTKGMDCQKQSLSDFMTPNPETLECGDPIAYALNKMSAGSYRNIPIMEDAKPKYMLSVKDIVDHISLTYMNTVINLPPDPHQETSQYGG